MGTLPVCIRVLLKTDTSHAFDQVQQIHSHHLLCLDCKEQTHNCACSWLFML